jgi:electron transfer flavoprotein beta subunit
VATASSSGDREAAIVIAVCMKWVDRRPEVDPLTGAVHTDVRTSGASDADEAALEWALRIGQAWDVAVIAVTAGPPDADAMLRDAVAAGAARAVRIHVEVDAASEDVAASIVAVLSSDVSVVVCGAWSIDRGSGSVPAYLAARLDAAQALGLVSLSFESTPQIIEAERRLDRGRRERLRVLAPAVVSVEGGSARLRRAALHQVLAARTSEIEVHDPPSPLALAAAPIRTVPFRPRPRVLPAPSPELSARERILSLSGALVDREPPRLVRLDPAAAADELLAQLQAWGYR